jgi:hypothetical protein
VTLPIVASLTDDTRSVHYHRNTFIIQATGCKGLSGSNTLAYLRKSFMALAGDMSVNTEKSVFAVSTNFGTKNKQLTKAKKYFVLSSETYSIKLFTSANRLQS